MMLLGTYVTLKVVHHIPIIGGKFDNISPKLIVVSSLWLGQTTILKEEIRRMISKVVPAVVEREPGVMFRG